MYRQPRHPLGKRFKTFLSDFDPEKLTRVARTSSYGHFSPVAKSPSSGENEEAQVRFTSSLDYLQSWTSS